MPYGYHAHAFMGKSVNWMETFPKREISNIVFFRWPKLYQKFSINVRSHNELLLLRILFITFVSTADPIFPDVNPG